MGQVGKLNYPGSLTCEGSNVIPTSEITLQLSWEKTHGQSLMNLKVKVPLTLGVWVQDRGQTGL